MAPCSDAVPSQSGGPWLLLSQDLACAKSPPAHTAMPLGTASCGCSRLRLRGADGHARWVAVPPNIEPSAVDLAILENGTVSLECLASGLPAPSESVLSLGSCSHTPGAFSGSPRWEKRQHHSLQLSSLLPSRHCLV